VVVPARKQNIQSKRPSIAKTGHTSGSSFSSYGRKFMEMQAENWPPGAPKECLKGGIAWPVVTALENVNGLF